MSLTAKYEWKPWTGGKCPVKRGVMVETKWDYGGTEPADDAHMLVWSHDMGSPKIVAYRVLSASERRQFNKEMRDLCMSIMEQTDPDGEIYGFRD